MTFDAILLIVIGAFSGGFISGLAGFGTGLFALGWWLAAMPVSDAVVLVVIMSLVGGVQGLYAVRNAVDLRLLVRFLVPALIGIAIGYRMLDHINIIVLKLVLATLLILFGGFFTFRKTLPKLTMRFLPMDLAVGGIGGVLAVLAGLSGALLTMWCSLYDWTKAQRRGVIQPFNMIILSIVFVLMMGRGLVTVDIVLLVAVALPSSVLGTQAGIASFRRLSDDQFQKLLIWLTLVSGLMLAGRELIARLPAG